MALVNNEPDLIDFIDPAAATQSRIEDEDLCSDMYRSMFSNIHNCIYLDSISKEVKFLDNHLILIHINIRSIHKNFDALYTFLQSFDYAPDLICLTETRLKHQPLSNISIPGYSFVHINSSTAAGGVAIYISNNVDFEFRKKQFQLKNSESIWINLLNNKKIYTTIGVVYRHPSNTDLNEFLDDFSCCMHEISSNKENFYLIGDFNINIEKTQRTEAANDYIDSIIANGALPIITLPTRVTSTSSTIIDHVITNETKREIFPFVIRNDLSDHYPVACGIEKLSRRVPKNTYKITYYRDKSNFDKDKFCDDLNCNLLNFYENSPSLKIENFNNIFNQFTELVLSTINIHAPLKPLSRKHVRLKSKPWLSKGILVSIRKRRQMFKSHFLLGDNNEQTFFRKYSNLLTKLISSAKKVHYTTSLEINKNDPKKVWDIIRSVLPTKNNSTNASNTQDCSNFVTNPNELASKTKLFNEFFCSIGKNLADKLPSSTNPPFENYLTNRISESIFLSPPSAAEIVNALHLLNVNKAVGPDNIPAYYLRVAASVIAPFLQYFIEFSFITGIFPANCSIARVFPLHKKGDISDPNNYRPISILSCFAKILERLIYDRFLAFLKKHNVIHKSQYGFQKGVCTGHAILDIVTNTFDNIKNNNYTGLIFLDLRKAFDTVSHDILLAKLNHYGIRGPALLLMQSFLNRRQYVCINNQTSENMPITYGVAQGSTLGPLLFLLYINDLANSVDHLPRLFADDTCLVVPGNNTNHLELIMNRELENVYKWCNANKLSLNPKKSYYLIISPKLRSNSPQISLLLNSIPISYSESIKYLGVIIDPHLNFKSHISSIQKKISRSVGILSKLKHFLPKTALLKIYYAIIHPHILYGLPVWGSTFSSYLNKLNTLQNKAVKTIDGGSYLDHATPCYSHLKILKISELFKLEVAKLISLHYSKNLPPLLSNLFVPTNQISSRSTRASSHENLSLYMPRFKTARLQRSIKYQGVKIWNEIPPSIKSKPTKLLKKYLKKYFLNRY